MEIIVDEDRRVVCDCSGQLIGWLDTIGIRILRDETGKIIGREKRYYCINDDGEFWLEETELYGH